MDVVRFHAQSVEAGEAQVGRHATIEIARRVHAANRPSWLQRSGNAGF
jgi:hypothetical protein